MSFQICKSFVRLRNTIQDILDENQEAKLHCQGPEMYEKHRQDTPSAISGSIITLWSDEKTFCMEIKQK